MPIIAHRMVSALATYLFVHPSTASLTAAFGGFARLYFVQNRLLLTYQ
jgi:hypothetical protein